MTTFAYFECPNSVIQLLYDSRDKVLIQENYGSLEPCAEPCTRGDTASSEPCDKPYPRPLFEAPPSPSSEPRIEAL